MITVDEIIRWPTKIRCFKAGSCHLTTDDVSERGIEELHAFAKKLGMHREWFQPGLPPSGEVARAVPHYDLTIERRERALREGATFVSGRVQAKARMNARKEREEA